MLRSIHVKVWLMKREVLPETEENATDPTTRGYAIKEAVQPFISAFWSVRATADPDDPGVNMYIKNLNVCVHTGIARQDYLHKDTIQVPSLVNSKTVNKDEDLCWYNADLKKASAKAKPAPAKARVAKSVVAPPKTRARAE